MIYIVTPVYNRKEFTQNYLSALRQQTNKNFKTVIVDDGSTDGTPDMIEKEFPEVVLLKEKGDLWWAEATNIGVRYAMKHSASYIMTLNDDTLPTPDYIENMIYQSNIKSQALLGALAINVHDDKLEYCGEILNWKTAQFENQLNRMVNEEGTSLYKVNTFPGRGLLVPVEVFEKIGFYDSKNFPQTVADLDFTARADNAGYEIYCNFDAKIKIYPDESAAVKLRKTKSLNNYYQHLFGKRGAANLKWFIIFAFKNAPKKYLLQFLFKGIARRVGGYLLEWVSEYRLKKQV